jgi:hypothetical protein
MKTFARWMFLSLCIYKELTIGIHATKIGGTFENVEELD